ncbi:hypothetical protein AFLA_001175 [Aspergillus flavus NRRL3357]|nr:hypothetical protein AFLA_001175 [Aspergillus flavus NRRL3357]
MMSSGLGAIFAAEELELFWCPWSHSLVHCYLDHSRSDDFVPFQLQSFAILQLVEPFASLFFLVLGQDWGP